MAEKLLICIVGPTAIGKTKMAIDLAKHYKTEIISADSRQFYKELSIGTAVPSKEELQTVKHHFIQHKSIFDTYTVGDFEKDALALLEALFIEKEVVIMVGGSGLYVDAITKGFDEFPSVDPAIRKELNEKHKSEGLESLQTLLKKLDEAYSGKVDMNNPQRLIRALEICLGTGKPYSSFLNQKRPQRPFKSLTLCLFTDREIIYDRIEKRVDAMIESGLLEEAKAVYPHQHLNALRTIGYQELFAHFDGKWEMLDQPSSLAFAISEIKKNTRRFAKRQLTWFKKDSNIVPIDNQTPIDIVVRKINDTLIKDES